jgi:hypothetical protein
MAGRNLEMKRFQVPLLLLIVVISFFPGGCNRGSVHQAIDKRVPDTDGNPKLIADYQPWFGDPDHIDVGYNSQDPAVIRKQIEQAKNMGIYAFAIDWYADRKPFLDRSTAVLAEVSKQMQFHYALMYDETEENNGHATEDALTAMDQAYKNYIGPQSPTHDAYLLYQGRPMIFIFPKRGGTNWDQVRQTVNGWENPPWLIYKDDPPPQYAKDFDGQYAWVHPGEKWMPDGSDWGKEYLERFYQKMKTKYPGNIVVGGAWPGFNDKRASWTLNRQMDTRCGKTFDETLSLFRKYYDESHPMPFLMIATWNDYEEGTAIEAGLPKCNATGKAGQK